METFFSGWCVGGARGVIADSQADAVRVAGKMGEELRDGREDEGE